MADKNSQGKVLLVILDGWGHNKDYPGNAISVANTPTWDKLWSEHPHMLLEASGEAVGLPAGQMGNSEINHAAIGSGRVNYSDLVKINKAVAEGKLHESAAINKAFTRAKENDSSLHLICMLSPGGVHSHEDHLFEMMREAKAAGVNKIFVHAISDGRDMPPKSCSDSFAKLEQVCQETGAELATIAGRFYAMDRDKNWKRTDLAYENIKNRSGKQFTNWRAAIEASYANDKADEFILPCTIKTSDNELAKVKTGDSAIFINFRNDRPRQLTERFIEQGPEDLFFVTMTSYSDKYPVAVAYGPEEVSQTLGEVLSENGIKQFRVTETEKFAHLTFFMNCKREEPYPLEERFMFDSNKVESHADKPEMRAPDIANKVVETMKSGQYPVIFTNICNGDMVGHTGDLAAAVKAVEAVDHALAKILETAKAEAYTLMITADHGNCDEMLDDEGNKVTAHSTNPVPFVLISPKGEKLNRERGIMADIAPTILKELGIKQPNEMTGKSLV